MSIIIAMNTYIGDGNAHGLTLRVLEGPWGTGRANTIGRDGGKRGFILALRAVLHRDADRHLSRKLLEGDILEARRTHAIRGHGGHANLLVACGTVADVLARGLVQHVLKNIESSAGQ